MAAKRIAPNQTAHPRAVFSRDTVLVLAIPTTPEKVILAELDIFIAPEFHNNRVELIAGVGVSARWIRLRRGTKPRSFLFKKMKYINFPSNRNNECEIIDVMMKENRM
ncbi:hypothetical protein [Paenibacillus silvisoli]|uniref:hypothetical protein n=1 Tax=Paenibacillus silvisoli TaxID=3110539 RepID=UPI00280501DC|nr:hypothetical protein [Paenibacillus silvisoli]